MANINSWLHRRRHMGWILMAFFFWNLGIANAFDGVYLGEPTNICLPNDDSFDFGQCIRDNFTILRSSINLSSTTTASQAAQIAAINISTPAFATTATTATYALNAASAAYASNAAGVAGGSAGALTYWTGNTTLGNTNLLRDNASSLTTISSITASAFKGDGSSLVNIPATAVTLTARHEVLTTNGVTKSWTFLDTPASCPTVRLILAGITLSDAVDYSCSFGSKVITLSTAPASGIQLDAYYLVNTSTSPQAALVNFANTFSSAQVVNSSMTATSFWGDGAHLTNTVGASMAQAAQVMATTGTAAAMSAIGSIQISTANIAPGTNGANQLVQNTSGGLLPVLDGSNLYNVKGSPVSPVVLYYALNMNSDIPGYAVLNPVPSILAESSRTVTVASSNTDYLISAFASPLGSPGQTAQPTGTSTRHLYLYSPASTPFIRAEMWIRHSNGNEVLMYTSTSTTMNGSTIAEYLVPITIAVSSTILTTDRYVCKIYARKTSGGSTTLTMYSEGSARVSRIDTTFKGTIQNASVLAFTVENGEAFTLFKGRPTYIIGGVHGLPDIGRADNTITNKSRVVGMLQDDCVSGGVCTVIRSGVLPGLNTSVFGSTLNAHGQTWTAGDLLFLDSHGDLTNVRPTSGRSVKVGYDLYGNSTSDAILSYPFENPVWTTAASGEDIVLRVGDSAGANQVSFRNYLNVGVATMTSLGGLNLAGALSVAGSTITTTGLIQLPLISAPTAKKGQIYAGTDGLIYTSVDGSNNVALSTGGAGGSGVSAVKTRQIFNTAGTFVYYSTASTGATPRQICPRLVAGGGGGGGSGTSCGTSATAGGNSTFGTNLLVAVGGGGALCGYNNGDGGIGGAASIAAPATGFVVAGSTGPQGGSYISASGVLVGVSGANSFFGGAGTSRYNADALPAAPNSGSGGGGAGGPQSAVVQAGGGGGAGGYVDACINTPSASYSITVGAGGSGGGAQTSGFAGGAGGTGRIIVEEWY